LWFLRKKLEEWGPERKEAQLPAKGLAVELKGRDISVNAGPYPGTGMNCLNYLS
jgi:hypothetical protein